MPARGIEDAEIFPLLESQRKREIWRSGNLEISTPGEQCGIEAGAGEVVPFAQTKFLVAVPEKNGPNRFHEVIRGARFMGKHIRLDHFGLSTAKQLKNWGLADLARLNPDPPLFGGRH